MNRIRRLLLVGAGHAHARVLKDFADRPLPGTELMLVSPQALTPYSGMVPGWLAGEYHFADICIDFAALARLAGARLLLDEVESLDPDQQRVLLKREGAVAYDVLSINVGSTLVAPSVAAGTHLLTMRPLGRLQASWNAVLTDPNLARAPHLEVTAVGGGAAGVEVLLAVLRRWRGLHPAQQVHGRLIARSPTLLPGMAPGAVRAAHLALAAAGVACQLDTTFEPDSTTAHPQLLLWATGAHAHAWQHHCGLTISEGGFIAVDEQLRSLSHQHVYATGDCAHWEPPLPKAGVFAVRMGPVLSNNLRVALQDGVGTGQIYAPQRRYLALLSTADGKAIASWGKFAAQGRWVRKWKNHIDRQFLRRFSAL